MDSKDPQLFTQFIIQIAINMVKNGWFKRQLLQKKITF